MLTVKLPYSIGTRDIPWLFQICKQIATSSDGQLELDGSDTEFIDPFGLSVLAAALSKANPRFISMPWLNKDVTSYMQRMNFFEHFDVHNILLENRQRHDQKDSCCELTKVDGGEDSDQVANRLADAIVGNLTPAAKDGHEDEATGKNQYDSFRHPIFYALTELLGNSLTHAKQGGNLRASVWVASQYYRNAGIVKMAVVDNGCGFLHTLEKHPKLIAPTHLGAIRTALIPTVSCNRDGTLYIDHANQGVGLTTTERIAKAAQGGLQIV